MKNRRIPWTTCRSKKWRGTVFISLQIQVTGMICSDQHQLDQRQCSSIRHLDRLFNMRFLQPCCSWSLFGWPLLPHNFQGKTAMKITHCSTFGALHNLSRPIFFFFLIKLLNTEITQNLELQDWILLAKCDQWSPFVKSPEVQCSCGNLKSANAPKGSTISYRCNHPTYCKYSGTCIWTQNTNEHNTIQSQSIL